MSTTVTDTYYGVDLVPQTGFVQYRAPADRASTSGGHIAPAPERSQLTNGALSLTLDPGLVYIQVVLSNCTYPEQLYNIPDKPTVVLSSLPPLGVIPTVPLVIDGGSAPTTTSSILDGGTATP